MAVWLLACCLIFVSCSGDQKNDYVDNSPTSGKLKVYYDEGLALHVKNQAYTFEALYPKVQVDLVETSENEAVQALYTDSCEAIVISRLLTDKEKKAFASKGFNPKYSAVAKSGIALITNVQTPLKQMSYEALTALLSKASPAEDTLGNPLELKVLFDKNNSAVLHYMLDSVLHGTQLSANCNILSSSLESINYVAAHKNTVALIDFAWLSDVDDSIYKANQSRIRFLSASKAKQQTFELPDQSSFKLGTYPFTRTVYVIRKTGDFTLAKGFESFVAGPKGQTTFLKQGLLPTRQQERAVHINMEAQP